MDSHHTETLPDDPQGLLYLTGRYLEHIRVRNYSPQTIYSAGKMLRYFRVFCQEIGVTQARQVTRAVVVNYQSYLFHYRKEASGTALTVSTQKHWLIAVANFFSWLTKEGLILYNPASDLELPRSEFRLPKTILTAAEVETILNVSDINDPQGLRDRAVLETLYSTGIRRQELCMLNLGDLDCDRGLIRVEQGKGHKDRFVPVGERAVRWIEKYLVESRPRFCPSLNEHALFINTEGRRMGPGRLGSHVGDLIRKSGVNKPGSCHLFRHTMATLLIEGGCPQVYVQQILGHARADTTAIYTHLSLRAVKEAHSRFHPAKMPHPSLENTPRNC